MAVRPVLPHPEGLSLGIGVAPTDYELSWKKNISLEGYPTGEKLEILQGMLAQIVQYNLNDEITRRTAERILDSYAVEQKDWLGEVVALWDWVRTEIRYTFDPRGIERFQTARRTLASRHGDCDDMASLLTSLLCSVGHEGCIFLCDANRKMPGSISHATSGVRLPVDIPPYHHKWIVLETTRMEKFGWKVPWASRWIRIDIKPDDLAKNNIIDADTIPDFENIKMKRAALW